MYANPAAEVNTQGSTDQRMGFTCAGLDSAFDEALPLLQKDALMLQRGTMKNACNALDNDAH